MKRHDVVWTAEAARELSEIIEGIFRASGHRRTADRYEDKFLTAVSRIGLVAEAGRHRNDLDSGLRTWVFDRKFIIADRILGERVRIVRVFGGRRDYPRLFGKRPP